MSNSELSTRVKESLALTINERNKSWRWPSDALLITGALMMVASLTLRACWHLSAAEFIAAFLISALFAVFGIYLRIYPYKHELELIRELRKAEEPAAQT